METFAHSARSLCRERAQTPAAFSLIEVTLAIAIVAIAFVPLFGLIPAGMSTFRQSMNTSIGSQIAQRVITDALQTDYDVLIDEAHQGSKDSPVAFQGPTIAAPAFRYFDDQGTEVQANADAREKIYWVNTRVLPQSADLKQVATVTVQVALNPGNRELALDGTTHLLTGTKGVEVQTYAAMIARNK